MSTNVAKDDLPTIAARDQIAAERIALASRRIGSAPLRRQQEQDHPHDREC